jgi:hypothetical protein
MVRSCVQASYSLLSVHYAVLYGGQSGWVELAHAQAWEYGPIGSWLPQAWDEQLLPLPDQQVGRSCHSGRVGACLCVGGRGGWWCSGASGCVLVVVSGRVGCVRVFVRAWAYVCACS